MGKYFGEVQNSELKTLISGREGAGEELQKKNRIIESLRLEKTSKIIKSNHSPNTTMPAKPCPQVPPPRDF